MPRSNIAERDAEFERFKCFALAFAEFLDADAVADPRPGWSGELGPDGQAVWTEHRGPPPAWAETLREGLKSLERARPRGWRAGLRQAVQDLLEMSRYLSLPKVQMADSYLRERGAPTLTVMRAEVWGTIPKIIKRGRIKTESEYYLLVERLKDASSDDLTEVDRERVAEMVLQFEQGRIQNP